MKEEKNLEEETVEEPIVVKTEVIVTQTTDDAPKVVSSGSKYRQRKKIAKVDRVRVEPQKTKYY